MTTDQTDNASPAGADATESQAAPSAPPAEATSSSASSDGAAPEAAPAPAAPAPAQPDDAASASATSDAAAGDASAHAGEEHDEEGDDDGGEEAPAAGDASATPGEGGEAPKKKRRRRRRKKGAGAPPGEAAAPVLGPDGEPIPQPEGAATEEGHEHHEGGEGHEGHEGHKHHKKRPDPREALPFRIGEEVFGKVEKVTDDAIWIDVAGKALGLFDRRDLGEVEPPAPGDQFIATVASHGLRGGLLRMARAPFPIDDTKAKVEAAKESGEPIEGFITGAVKAGVEVDIDGLRAFAPASLVQLRPGGDLSHLVGRRFKFNVIQYEKKGRDVVVSRKKFLADEAASERAEALKTLQPGSIHKGVVRTVVQWGVFVALPDAGGLEGLVHVSEASHDRTAKLTELFKPGDPVDVKVLKIDQKGKIELSRKAMTNDPWDAVQQKFAPGTRHKGKVVRIQPFGAFIELEPGIDGLCYTQDLSLKPVAHPRDIVKVDEEIDVIVANCDGATRRISLHPAPPVEEEGEPRPKVGPNRILKCVVVLPSEPGLLVRIVGLTGRAARGFIPAGHTGTQRGTDLRKVFPVGHKLDAKVLEVDTRRGETKLSIRALKDDAEKQAYAEYRDQVSREAKFGTFADLMKK
ncbi:MAG: S1 RNA-binding domain-containing protein [Polyangiaceae bacterium]